MVFENEDDQVIRDPSVEGWLSDICSGPVETLVTPSGTVKLPGRSTRFTDGIGKKYRRVEYFKWSKTIIGMGIDPVRTWYVDMYHSPIPPEFLDKDGDIIEIELTD